MLEPLPTTDIRLSPDSEPVAIILVHFSGIDLN